MAALLNAFQRHDLGQVFNPVGRRQTHELVREFQHIFALPAQDDNLAADGHDTVHALSGFGITIADELRVDAYITSLVVGPDFTAEAVIDEAMRSMHDLHLRLREQARDPHAAEFNVGQSGLDHLGVLATQAEVEPLSRAEVEAHVHLARTLDYKLHELLGRGLFEQDDEDIISLDFGILDVSVEAARIKAHLQSANNAKIEEAAVGMMHAAAEKLGRGDDIAAPNTPWHGPARRPFRM